MIQQANMTARALLACILMGTIPTVALAQKANATSIVGALNIRWNIEDLAADDGIVAASRIDTGYLYAAGRSGDLVVGQALDGTELWSGDQRELTTTLTSDRITGGSRFAGFNVGLDGGYVRASTAGLPNEGAVAYQGSVMDISVTPHTRVTFTIDWSGVLEINSPGGYQNHGSEDLPGVRSIAYTYFGPVKIGALPEHGYSSALFDPDADGFICSACEEDQSYWHAVSLSPTGYPVYDQQVDAVELPAFTQQYSFTNNGDSDRVFQLLRFSGAAVMNVIQPSPVPEPSSVTLLGLGMLALLTRGRLRRSTSLLSERV